MSEPPEFFGEPNQDGAQDESYSGRPNDPGRHEFAMGREPKLVEIPKLFHSLEKDGPFTRCIHCDRNFELRSDEPYVIERVFKGTEPIIELAMCFDCREEKAGEGLSAESLKAIQQFLAIHMDMHRLNKLAEYAESEGIDPWISTCLLSGEARDDVDEFQVVAVCAGDKIIRDFFPAMISGKALEQMAKVLSEKTRGWMDDYVGDNFGMPSEFCEPPTLAPLLM